MFNPKILVNQVTAQHEKFGNRYHIGEFIFQMAHTLLRKIFTSPETHRVGGWIINGSQKGIVAKNSTTLIPNCFCLLSLEKELKPMFSVFFLALFLNAFNCIAQINYSNDSTSDKNNRLIVLKYLDRTIGGINSVKLNEYGKISFAAISEEAGEAGPEDLPLGFLKSCGIIRTADGGFQEQQSEDEIILPPKNQIPKNTPGNVRVLIERLYSHDAVKRGRAAYDLGRLGPAASAATLFLIKILPDTRGLEWVSQNGRISTGVQVETIEALGRIGDSRAVPSLVELLQDDDLLIRGYSAIALGKIHSPMAVEALIEVLNTNGWHDPVENAADALGNIGEKRAIEPLINALLIPQRELRASTNPDARLAIIKALDKLKAIEAIESLQKIVASTEEEDDVRHEAKKAIADIARKTKRIKK